MLYQNKRTRIIALALILALILTCAFIVFLPSSHECVGADCIVCTIIESSRSLLTATAAVAVLHQAAKTAVCLLSAYSDSEPMCDETPVELKVKLSD
jgi:hypothetical protein